MLWTIASFEFRFQLKQMILPVTFGIFFLLTFGATTVDNITIGSTGNVNINSPFAITTVTIIMSIFGLFIPTAMLTNVVLRDAELKTEESFFTLPIRPWEYLLGRFLGAFPVTMIAFASVPLGVLIGSFMPWLNPDRVGPTVLWHYLYTLFVVGVPNLLITGLIFFTVANLTRSMIATYTTLVAFLIVYFVGLQVVNEPELINIVALADPFGILAFGEVTQYWTAFERNERVLPLEGLFLQNRLIWLGVSGALLILNLLTFSFRKRQTPRLFRSKTESPADSERFVARPIDLPRVTPDFGAATASSQFWIRTRFEMLAVLKSIAFWVLLALGIFNTLGGLLTVDLVYGTPIYPVTRQMIQVAQGNFALVPFIVVIYWASEVVWRERMYFVHEVIGATPTPNWVFVFSKFAAMALVLISLQLVAIVTAIAVQLAQGFTAIELDLYLGRFLVVFGWPFLLLAILSLFVQSVSMNRFMGMLIMVVVLVAQLSLFNAGFEHNLYQFAGAPAAPLSDMNGSGHYLTAVFWFYLYWSFFSALLILLTYMLWNRGAPTDLWTRIKRIGTATGPVTVTACAIALAGFVGSGAWIYYNTNILNAYVTQADTEKRAIAYEEAYRQYETMALPKIAAVKADVDIHPYELKVETRGTYRLENRTDAPLDTVHVDMPFALAVSAIELEGAALKTEDTDLNYRIYTLDTPMAPGDSRTLRFTTVWDYDGFRNSGNGTRIVYNGTFVNNTEIMPLIGFNRGKMIQNRNDRRRNDLEPIDRMPKLEQTEFYRTNLLRLDSDWVEFETTVSTVPDQIAVAPGYLQREWTEGDRRYFEYKMNAPIQNFYSFMSADYTVARDDWNGVALEIYYHEPHSYNIDGMMAAMKASFDYFTANFSPYQYSQMRILEFPDYARFAQAFPNTVPYSEGIGFIADVRDPEDVDYVTFVTAHELAHQWWAHQMSAAPVQGSTMLIESFAQYSAVMVMEEMFGIHHIRQFLKYELDSYLRARGGEQVEELPLYRVENQGYIHYRKGAVAMYALKDYVGEDTVNRVLARLLDEKAYAFDPYPISLDFLRILREEADPKHEELIQDLFERITLWDLKVTETEVTERGDGRFDVALTIEAAKYEADGLGRETERPLDMEIDIGAFTEHPGDVYEGDDHVLLFEKRRIVSGEQTVTVTLDERPAVVGVDPYNKLIDRNSDDNLKRP